MGYNTFVENSLLLEKGVTLKQTVLRVVWWNCGLSGLLKKLPKSGDALSKDDVKKLRAISIKMTMTKEVIKKLAEQSDVLVLGEFSWGGDTEAFVSGLINDLKSAGVDFGYENLSCEISGTKMLFDNFVLYNKSLIKIDNVSHCSNIGTKRRRINYRAYQTVSFQHLTESNFKGEMAIVHWGMRNGFGGDTYESHRLMAAEKLAKRLSTGMNYPYKIIVGDFNNEPYEDSFRWLSASRSIEYAQNYDALYNPFWRFLDGTQCTIYSKNNHDFKDNGAVFDNIIVNSKFLDATKPWELTPGILEEPLSGYSMGKHDHYPIAMDFKV